MSTEDPEAGGSPNSSMLTDSIPGPCEISQDTEYGFFKLPPELRVMIYKLCLVPGLIRPFTQASAQRKLPGLSLLCTCKAILNEARYELYKNTFIVSDWYESDLIYEACLRYPERRPMLKSLELRFGAYELEDDHKSDVTVEVEEEYPSEAFQQFGPRASRTKERVRRREIHTRLKATLRDVLWCGKMSHILDDTELEHLRLNLYECDCHLECCDLYYNAFWTFKPGFARAMPKRLELVGVTKPSPKVERLRKDWVGITTFGTLTRTGLAPVEQEMIKQLKGWDYDSFMRKVTRELEKRGDQM